MRVLMVTPSYYPIKGGAEAVVRSLSIKLNEIGVNTDIMTFNMNRKWSPLWKANVKKTDGIDVFRIPAFNWFPMEHSDRITLGVNLIPGRFKHLLKKYDIIHFHGADLSFPLFSYTVNKPKIFHSHGFSFNFYKRYFLSRLILRNIADLYVSIWRQEKKQFIELGIPEHKIKYLPNGVDVEFFRPSGKKEDNLILFVGRITFAKGLHVLLKSLQYLEKPVNLVIIGPPDWDLEYSEQMFRQINNENKRGIHKITYLGAQDPANIVRWYQKSSIFILPSFREAFPLTILEALSCETPVITTNVGGIPEVVRHGENGIIVQSNNAVKLADMLRYLLNNKDVRIRFGQEGRKCIIKRFSSEVIVKRLYRIYKEMLEYRKLNL